jgi:phosphate transport system substrate-binding protein
MKLSHLKLFSLAPIFLASFLLAACTPSTQSVAESSVLHVAISPAAQPVSHALQNCAAKVVSIEESLIIEGRYLSLAELDSLDFAIQLGDANAGADHVLLIAEESLAVISHPSNPVRNLSRDQFVDLFSGRISNWSELDGADAAIAVSIGSAKDEARKALEDEWLAGSSVRGDAMLAFSPQQLVDAVANDVNAISVLPFAWLDDTVRAEDSGILLPVLALAMGELSHDAQAVLACLQGEQGKSILAESYSPLNGSN